MFSRIKLTPKIRGFVKGLSGSNKIQKGKIGFAGSVQTLWPYPHGKNLASSVVMEALGKKLDSRQRW